MDALAWLVTLLGAGAVGLLAPQVLRRLREPTDDATKVPYRSLATPRFALVVAAAALAAGTIGVVTHAWLPLLAVSTVGVLAAAIDARTTYLPLRLAHAAWLLGLAAVAAASLAQRSPAPLARGLAVGAVCLGAGWLAWRLLRFGYGDARLASVVGGCAAAHSLALAWGALLFGSLVGACWGVVVRLRGSRAPFAYGPGLVAGPYLAALALAAAG